MCEPQGHNITGERHQKKGRRGARRSSGGGGNGSGECWGRGRGSSGYRTEHKDSKYQEAQRNIYLDDHGSQVTLLRAKGGYESDGEGSEGERRKEMDGRIVVGVVPTMFILHHLGHTYLYIFRGIVLHRRSL